VYRVSTRQNLLHRRVLTGSNVLRVCHIELGRSQVILCVCHVLFVTCELSSRVCYFSVIKERSSLFLLREMTNYLRVSLR
jgi:hypothetical protein